MLSRGATSLTLLGRHLERADHLARILGVHVALSLDRTDEPGPEFWTRFMELAGWPGGDTNRRDQAVQVGVTGLLGASGPACFAFEWYRARCSGGVTPGRVMECLLLDPTLPRSAVFSARVALDSVSSIDGPGHRSKPKRILSRLHGMFLETSTQAVADHPRD